MLFSSLVTLLYIAVLFVWIRICGWLEKSWTGNKILTLGRSQVLTCYKGKNPFCCVP